MRSWNRWMLGSLIALAMPGAWAQGGARINFTGVVLEPTCAADATQAAPVGALSPQAMQPSGRLVCGQTATDPGRTYSRTVQAVDATSIANDRLLGYLASYAVGPDGQPAADLVIRTYD